MVTTVPVCKETKTYESWNLTKVSFLGLSFKGESIVEDDKKFWNNMNGKLCPGTVNQMGHVRCPQCAEIPPVGPLTVIVIIIQVDNLIPERRREFGGPKELCACKVIPSSNQFWRWACLACLGEIPLLGLHDYDGNHRATKAVKRCGNSISRTQLGSPH